MIIQYHLDFQDESKEPKAGRVIFNLFKRKADWTKLTKSSTLCCLHDYLGGINFLTKFLTNLDKDEDIP